MNDTTDRQELVDALNEFAIIHGRELKPEAFAIYWKIIKNAKLMDIEGLRYAIQWLRERHRFFPLPADFVQAERRRWG